MDEVAYLYDEVIAQAMLNESVVKCMPTNAQSFSKPFNGVATFSEITLYISPLCFSIALITQG